jgi:hypothetical protein
MSQSRLKGLGFIIEEIIDERAIKYPWQMMLKLFWFTISPLQLIWDTCDLQVNNWCENWCEHFLATDGNWLKLYSERLLNSFSSGRKVAILSGVVLNAYIFQTIHRTETEIASFERGVFPLSKIPISISSRAWLTSYSHKLWYKKCCNYA